MWATTLEDVIGAQLADLTAVWINRSGDTWPHEQQPHVQVNDLAEVAALLIPRNDFLQQQENIVMGRQVDVSVIRAGTAGSFAVWGGFTK